MAKDDPRVGVVGLGQMGRGIARNLQANGLLVAVHDTNSDAVTDIAVPQLAGQALVDASDIILFAVPSTAEIRTELEACTGTSLIVDLTTSSPEQSTGLAGDLETQGFAYIDAAMTGGASGADEGTLTLMIGGADEDVARCGPVFAAIASQRFHLGPIGSGHAMKLVHNLILHSAFMATCEGLCLAERAGLDLDKAVDVLNAGNARSFVTETRFPRDILSGTMNARSVISNLSKDLGLAASFAATHSAPAPYTNLTETLLSAATKNGHEKTDFSHLFPLFDSLVADGKP